MAEDIAQGVTLAFTHGRHWVTVENPAEWATLATKRRILNIVRDRDRPLPWIRRTSSSTESP